MTYFVHCPHCQQSLYFTAPQLREAGGRAQCNQCATIFRIREPETPELVVPAALVPPPHLARPTRMAPPQSMSAARVPHTRPGSVSGYPAAHSPPGEMASSARAPSPGTSGGLPPGAPRAEALSAAHIPPAAAAYWPSAGIPDHLDVLALPDLPPEQRGTRVGTGSRTAPPRMPPAHHTPTQAGETWRGEAPHGKKLQSDRPGHRTGLAEESATEEGVTAVREKTRFSHSAQLRATATRLREQGRRIDPLRDKWLRAAHRAQSTQWPQDFPAQQGKRDTALYGPLHGEADPWHDFFSDEPASATQRHPSVHAPQRISPATQQRAGETRPTRTAPRAARVMGRSRPPGGAGLETAARRTLRTNNRLLPREESDAPPVAHTQQAVPPASVPPPAPIETLRRMLSQTPPLADYAPPDGLGTPDETTSQIIPREVKVDNGAAADQPNHNVAGSNEADESETDKNEGEGTSADARSAGNGRTAAAKAEINPALSPPLTLPDGAPQPAAGLAGAESSATTSTEIRGGDTLPRSTPLALVEEMPEHASSSGLALVEDAPTLRLLDAEEAPVRYLQAWQASSALPPPTAYGVDVPATVADEKTAGTEEEPDTEASGASDTAQAETLPKTIAPPVRGRDGRAEPTLNWGPAGKPEEYSPAEVIQTSVDDSAEERVHEMARKEAREAAYDTAQNFLPFSPAASQRENRAAKKQKPGDRTVRGPFPPPPPLAHPISPRTIDPSLSVLLAETDVPVSEQSSFNWSDPDPTPAVDRARHQPSTYVLPSGDGDRSATVRPSAAAYRASAGPGSLPPAPALVPRVHPTRPASPDSDQIIGAAAPGITPSGLTVPAAGESGQAQPTTAKMASEKTALAVNSTATTLTAPDRVQPPSSEIRAVSPPPATGLPDEVIEISLEDLPDMLVPVASPSAEAMIEGAVIEAASEAEARSETAETELASARAISPLLLAAAASAVNAPSRTAEGKDAVVLAQAAQISAPTTRPPLARDATAMPPLVLLPTRHTHALSPYPPASTPPPFQRPPAPRFPPLGERPIEPANPPPATFHPMLTPEDQQLLHVPKPPGRWAFLWPLGTGVLTLLLVGQLLFFYRTDLMIQLPGLKPVFQGLCKFAGCRIALPARNNWLRTDWSELNYAPESPNLIQFNAVVYNQAAFAQQVPYMMLTLMDETHRIVTRRVFSPAEYLAPLADGTPAPMPVEFASHSEIQAFLQIDLGNLRSRNYAVDWKYPQWN